jgi:ATP-dependent Zn protease
MDGFFRTALFPLIVIVLLVYLASQTLLGAGDGATKVAYSKLVDRVRNDPAAFRRVVFSPNKHVIRAELVDDSELEANYPTPQSQIDFERLLRKNNITFDFEWGGDSSAWWPLLTSLLPFVLLFGFWSFLTNRQGRQGPRVRKRLRQRSDPFGGD